MQSARKITIYIFSLNNFIYLLSKDNKVRQEKWVGETNFCLYTILGEKLVYTHTFCRLTT